MKKSLLISIASLLLLVSIVSAGGNIERGGGLQITEVTSQINDIRQTNIDYNGNIDHIAKPGDKVTLFVEVSNIKAFNEIEDVITTIFIDNIGGVVFERDSEQFNLKADKRSVLAFDFFIPLSTKQGTYKIELTAKGWDYEDRERQEVIFNLFLTVGKKTKEVPLIDSRLSASKLACGDDVIVSNSVANRGLDEEDATLTITSIPLGLYWEHPFKLAGGEYYQKSYQLKIPKDTKAGLYNIISTVSFQEGFARDILKLDIGCKEESQEIAEVEEAVYVSISSANPPIHYKTETNDSGYMVILVLLLIIITILLIIFLAVLL